MLGWDGFPARRHATKQLFGLRLGAQQVLFRMKRKYCMSFQGHFSWNLEKLRCWKEPFDILFGRFNDWGLLGLHPWRFQATSEIYIPRFSPNYQACKVFVNGSAKIHQVCVNERCWSIPFKTACLHNSDCPSTALSLWGFLLPIAQPGPNMTRKLLTWLAARNKGHFVALGRFEIATSSLLK